MCGSIVKDISNAVGGFVNGVTNTLNPANISNLARNPQGLFSVISGSKDLASFATLGLGKAYETLVEEPQKRAEEMAQRQIEAQEAVVRTQQEQERVNNLNYQRDLQRIRARGVARSRSFASAQPSFISQTTSSTSGAKTLIGS